MLLLYLTLKFVKGAIENVATIACQSVQNVWIMIKNVMLFTCFIFIQHFWDHFACTKKFKVYKKDRTNLLCK